MNENGITFQRQQQHNKKNSAKIYDFGSHFFITDIDHLNLNIVNKTFYKSVKLT